MKTFREIFEAGRGPSLEKIISRATMQPTLKKYLVGIEKELGGLGRLNNGKNIKKLENHWRSENGLEPLAETSRRGDALMNSRSGYRGDDLMSDFMYDIRSKLSSKDKKAWDDAHITRTWDEMAAEYVADAHPDLFNDIYDYAKDNRVIR